jgi:hypothetical protein
MVWFLDNIPIFQITKEEGIYTLHYGNYMDRVY